MVDSTAGLENSASVFGAQAKALPVGAMVRDIAVGVAQAQAHMDRNAVELLKEFANKNIDLYGDGKKQVSLLELGFAPQFLYFQRVTIKVHMDLRFHVEEQSAMGFGANLSASHESTTAPATTQTPAATQTPESTQTPATA